MELKRPNATLHYQLEGDESQPLIVFANSLGTNLHIWDEMLPFMSGYRFLRYDKRGHGQSRFTGEFGMQELVHDAIAVIEEVGARDVIFVGLSIGGMIGQGVCAERPDLVKGFVLMDSAAKIGTEGSWRTRIETVRADGIASISENVMKLWFTKAFRDAGLDAPWRAMLDACPLDGYTACCNAIAHTDLFASTARLKTPTLALVGSEDGSTPPDLVRETAELIDGAQFKIIRKAGHIPCVEQPEETAKLIRAFIGGLS